MARRATGSPTRAPRTTPRSPSASPSPSPPPLTWSPRASDPSRPNSSPPRRTPSAARASCTATPPPRSTTSPPSASRPRTSPNAPISKPTKPPVVGAANALAAWGDLLDDPREAAPVLERAERRYETAANAELARLDRVDAGPASSAARSATFMSASADALAALWNLADARVKRGECAGRLGDAEAANALFDSAFRTYEAACGRADSAAGDDLGGLLHDWGCGLVAAAQTLADAARAVKDTNDARSAALCAAAHHALDAAEEKLRHASEFSAGDFAPLNASGEAAQCRAELMLRVPRGGAREGDSHPAPVHTLEAIDAALRRATDPSFGGFGAALRVDSKNNDANVGVAECAAERGRAVVLVLGDAAKAAPHFRDAWMKFRAVLEEAARGGEGNGGGRIRAPSPTDWGWRITRRAPRTSRGNRTPRGGYSRTCWRAGVYPGGHTGGRGSEGVTPEVLGGGSAERTQSKQSASTRGSSFGIRMRSRVVNPKKLVIRRRSTISVPPDRTARPDHAW